MMQIYILQIDTATEICSVSLSLNGITIASLDASEPNLHASSLTLFINQLLSDAGISFAQLSAVCVSKGPGSYTGLRIGVSTAKGLCYALDIPLLAINTLEMMYFGYEKSDDVDCLYIPMLDARRMEVYLSIFDSTGFLVLPTEAKIIDVDSFSRYSDKKMVLFGSGAAKLTDLFKEDLNISVISSFEHSSKYMSNMAYLKYTKQEFEDLVYFEPFYLKEFIALLPKKVL